MITAIEQLTTLHLLKKTPNGVRLKRPISIVFPRNIITELKQLYRPNTEAGGLMELTPMVGGLGVSKLHVLPNMAAKSYHYQPSQVLWQATVQHILSTGGLPMAFHTHPTTLGIDAYDNRRQRFYLRASNADRRIANEGITPELMMPECIFVRDDRFQTGYGLAIYEGVVFPNHIAALSDAQLVALAAAAGLLWMGNLTRKVLYALVLWFVVEFVRRPRYLYHPNGSLTIKVSH